MRIYGLERWNGRDGVVCYSRSGQRPRHGGQAQPEFDTCHSVDRLGRRLEHERFVRASEKANERIYRRRNRDTDVLLLRFDDMDTLTDATAGLLS